MINKFDGLPDEIILIILQTFRLHELTLLAQVCRRFFRIVHDKRFWHAVSFLPYDSDVMNKLVCQEFYASMEIYSPLSLSDSRILLSPTHSEGSLIMGDDSQHAQTTASHGLQRSEFIPSISTPVFYERFFHSYGFAIVHLDLKRCIHVDTSTMIAIASTCTALKSLDISRCKNISYTAIKTILSSCLPHLSTVSCREIGARVGPSSLLAEKPNPYIKILDFGKNRGLNDALLAQIPISFPNLYCLGLYSCDMITNIGVEKLVTGCSNLCILEISDCPQLDDSIWHSIASHSKLEQIGFSAPPDTHGTDDFPTQDLLKFIESNENITFLNLSCRDAMEDAPGIVAGLTQHCRELKSLDISYSGILGSGEIRSVLGKFPMIESLRVAGNSFLSDESFHELGTRLGENLKKLDISNSGISFETLLLIIQNCKSLEHLIANSCHELSAAPFDHTLVRQPISCKIKYLELDKAVLTFDKVNLLCQYLCPNSLFLLSINTADLVQSVCQIAETFPHLQRLDVTVHQQIVEENDIRCVMSSLSQLSRLQHLKFEYFDPSHEFTSLPVHQIDDCVKLHIDRLLSTETREENEIVWRRERRTVQPAAHRRSNEPLLSLKSSQPNLPQFAQLTRTFTNLNSLEFVGSLNSVQLDGFFSFSFPALCLIQADLESMESCTDFGKIIERCPSLACFICTGSHSSEFEQLYQKLRFKYPHIRFEINDVFINGITLG